MEKIIFIIIALYFLCGLLAVIYGLQFGAIIVILAPAMWLAEKTGFAKFIDRLRHGSPAFSATLTIFGYIIGYSLIWLVVPWLFWTILFKIVE